MLTFGKQNLTRYGKNRKTLLSSLDRLIKTNWIYCNKNQVIVSWNFYFYLGVFLLFLKIKIRNIRSNELISWKKEKTSESSFFYVSIKTISSLRQLYYYYLNFKKFNFFLEEWKSIFLILWKKIKYLIILIFYIM